MGYDKIVDSAKLNNDLKLIANAIRNKTSKSGLLSFPNQFISEINSIKINGGDIPIQQDIEFLSFVPPSISKFKKNTGYVIIWGWGEGKSPTGTEWDKPYYIFLGDKYSAYVGGETTPMALSIEADGSIKGIPSLEIGEIFAIRSNSKIDIKVLNEAQRNQINTMNKGKDNTEII